MKKQDLALTCPNPRLIAAIYFGLLSVVGTILINALLSSLGLKEIIPLYAAIILGMLVSSITAAICGDWIIHCTKPYKLRTFLIGFFMVLLSLPFFDLGFFLMVDEKGLNLLPMADQYKGFYLYLAILVYSYLLFGFLLALGSGLAAMYLRGQLVYDLLGTYEPERPIKKLPDSPIEKNKIEHSDRVRISHK